MAVQMAADFAPAIPERIMGRGGGPKRTVIRCITFNQNKKYVGMGAMGVFWENAKSPGMVGQNPA